MKHPSSFRDPSNYIFTHNNVLMRQINPQYKADYALLISSGLYKSLTEQELLITHKESNDPPCDPENVYKIIKPEIVSFISYPYEWCFSQLKSAALTTLQIQKIALSKGMSLKDASAYNIQFHQGKPILIDTCSFEEYKTDTPWVAYRQFCQHFLCPLALMSYRDIRFNHLLKDFIDGIPLDFTSKILPLHTRLNFSLLLHIHFHAKSDQMFSGKKIKPKTLRTRKIAIEGIVDDLISTINKLTWKQQKTEWAQYYTDTNYTEAGIKHKQKLIAAMLNTIKPKKLWDLGANTGMFSQIAADLGIETIAFDSDPAAHEQHYLNCNKKGCKNILPLSLDLANPSPSIGWQNQERVSLIERGPADAVMALALIHHLAIGNNIPFEKIAEFLSTIAKSLIIEFVPKDDSQIQRLLVVRQDIFRSYTQENFEKQMEQYFIIEETANIQDSKRILYRMTRKDIQCEKSC